MTLVLAQKARFDHRLRYQGKLKYDLALAIISINVFVTAVDKIDKLVTGCQRIENERI